MSVLSLYFIRILVFLMVDYDVWHRSSDIHMKLREEFGCNPWKSWFFKLPDQKVPVPDYPVFDDGMIVILPLFQPKPDLPFLTEFLVKSACHVRASWIAHTDAIDCGVPFKFYVEESQKDFLVPIFERNFVDVDRDVLYFVCPDEEPPPCNDMNHWRKKLCFLLDDRFSNYEWTLVCDCDLFVSRGANWNGQKMQIFDRLLKHELNYGLLRYSQPSPDNIINWVESLDLSDNSLENKKSKFFDVVKSLVDVDLFQRVVDPSGLPTVACSLHVFPSRYFMSDRYSDCRWLYDAAQHLDNDEAVMSIWSLRDGCLWDFCDAFNVKCVYANQFESFNKYEIYLSHVGQQSEEYYWRKSISL